MKKIIEIRGITKRFKDKTAVDNVSFSIEKGTVTAFLGPNGAGKTTMIAMMLGLLIPTEGKIEILGRSPKEQAVKNKLGAMLQEVSVIDGITVGESIDLFRSYYSNPMKKQELLKLVELQKEEKKMADSLSGGQKRRLGFALALSGNPDVLFLDEPTVGMDITARMHFWERIRHLSGKGKTVILTTHYLEEADQLADRIILFSKGKIIADGTPQGIKATITRHSVSFTMEEPVPASTLVTLPNVTDVSIKGKRVTLYTDDTDAVLREVFERNIKGYDFDIERGRLDEAFEKLVGGEIA